MNKAGKVLIVILSVIPFLCAAGAAGVLLRRRSGKSKTHGEKKDGRKAFHRKGLSVLRSQFHSGRKTLLFVLRIQSQCG